MFKIFKYIKFHENLRLIGLFVCFVVVVVVCLFVCFWGEGEERGHYPIIGRESCYICKNVS